MAHQAVHADAYIIKNMKGHYVKDDKGSYMLFRTHALAKDYIEKRLEEDAYTLPVRVAITPTVSGRTRRVVALYSSQPQEVSQTNV